MLCQILQYLVITGAIFATFSKFFKYFYSVIIRVSCCRVLLGGYIFLVGFLGGFKKVKEFIVIFWQKRGDNNEISCLIFCLKVIIVLLDIGFSGGIETFNFCGRFIRAVLHFVYKSFLVYYYFLCFLFFLRYNSWDIFCVWLHFLESLLAIRFWGCIERQCAFLVLYKAH